MTLTSTGMVLIVASQTGDDNWNPVETTNTYVVTGLYNILVESAHGITVPATGIYTMLVNTVWTNQVQTPDTHGATQYVCTGWSMPGHDPSSGVDTQVVMTVTNNATLTWLWTTNYWLDTEAGTHGSVNVGDGWQAFGITTQITALADTYYHLTNWTGDTSGSANPLDLLMDAPKSVTAYFAENLATNRTPEWWLASYGWTTNFDAAALDDQDGDGMPTWKEYVAGTVPTNAASVFVTEPDPVFVLDHEVVRTNEFSEVYTVSVFRVESMILTWPSATGRVYSIIYGSAVGDFDTALATNLPATPSWNSFTCDVHGVSATTRYYRVGVHIP